MVSLPEKVKQAQQALNRAARAVCKAPKSEAAIEALKAAVEAYDRISGKDTRCD
jgi:predicted lipoprotein